MYRRDFLSTLVGGVFVNAAVRTWPFRVYSLPSKIVIPTFASIGPPMSEILAAELEFAMHPDAMRGFWAVTVGRTNPR